MSKPHSKTPERSYPDRPNLKDSSDRSLRLIPKLMPYSPSETIGKSEIFLTSKAESETGGSRQFSRLRKRSTRNKELNSNMQKVYVTSSSRKMIKTNSFITDVVFNEEQSPAHWNKIVEEIRNDPALFKQILQGKGEVSDKGNSRPASRVKCRPASGMSRKSNKNFGIETRSASRSRGIKVQDRREKVENYEKTENFDWSRSKLESLVSKNEFTIPEDILSNHEIEEIMLTKTFDDPKLLNKAEKTLERLKEELLLPKIYMQVHDLNFHNLDIVLKNCLTLYKARGLIVKILKLIHEREDLMLKSISTEELNPGANFEALEKLRHEIIQTIAFLKHSKFPLDDFIYLGENYEKKMEKDSQMFMSLYPGVKSTEIFEDFNC
jgi:hypothetical protein